MTPARIFLTGSLFFSYIVLDIIGFHSLSSLIIMHLMGLFLVPLLYSFPYFSTLLPFLCWSLFRNFLLLRQGICRWSEENYRKVASLPTKREEDVEQFLILFMAASELVLLVLPVSRCILSWVFCEVFSGPQFCICCMCFLCYIYLGEGMRKRGL